MLTTIGQDLNQPLTPGRRRFIQTWLRYALRALLFLCGYHFVNYWHVEADYTKYLGKDYEKDLVTGNTLVANHSAWTDIAFFLSSPWCPSFLSKIGVLKAPGIGIIAKSIRCIFVDRADA